jgi:hypothetical protein
VVGAEVVVDSAGFSDAVADERTVSAISFALTGEDSRLQPKMNHAPIMLNKPAAIL